MSVCFTLNNLVEISSEIRKTFETEFNSHVPIDSVVEPQNFKFGWCIWLE